MPSHPRRYRIASVLVLAALAAWGAMLLRSVGAAAQDRGRGYLQGRLLSDDTGNAIYGGVVHLLRDSAIVYSSLTGEDGAFALEAEPGTYRVRAEALGYRTAVSRGVDLVADDTLGVEFRLSVDAVVLDPLSVIARGITADERGGLAGMDDFLDRYARYAGSPFTVFVTRDSLRVWEDRVQSTGHMLDRISTLVRAVDPVTGAVTLRGGCVPTYYLNGFRVPFETVQTLSPGLLEAAEIYLRPAIPAPLAHQDPCGVVVLWSRRSPPDELPEKTILRKVGTVFLLGALAYLIGSTIW
ncbi:MAG: carboxypeptidase-like regulatory domain-containing protein [Gemmatimonadota bacterium]